MEITRIDVLSTGRVVGLVYAALGLVFGAFVTLMVLVGTIAGSMMGGIGRMDGTGGMMGGMVDGWIFGAAAVVTLPLIQGVLGFLTGVLVAWIYNGIAPRWGGLVLELRERASPGG